MNSMRRVMKTEKQVRELCREEVKNRYEEISKDVAYQSFAMCFYVLNMYYGFGAKRLNDLKDAIELEYWKMQEAPLGVKYDPDDVIKLVKERFGIDFSVSQFKE